MVYEIALVGREGVRTVIGNAKQVIQGNAQNVAERRKQVGIRPVFACLPVDDRVSGDMQQVGKALLGDLCFFAILFDHLRHRNFFGEGCRGVCS